MSNPAIRYDLDACQDEKTGKWSAFVVEVTGKFERVVQRLDYRYDTEADALKAAKQIADDDAKKKPDRVIEALKDVMNR